MKKNIYIMAAVLLSAFMLQSCFQDMDHPAFNYPDSNAEKIYSPVKLELPFEDDIRDKGNYGFIVRADGSSSFADGINGRAYQGASKAYILASTPAYLKDSISGLGSFTVAFWMKSKKNTTAAGLFSLANTESFWANIDVMLENNNSDTEAFFKIHLLNENSGTTDERWVTSKIENVFGDEWVHLAFCYDGHTSIVTIYKNGAKAYSEELPGYGKLKFKNTGAIVVGGFHFSPNPSLTSATTAPDWAGTYPGLMDQFHFYDKAINEEDVRKLYDEKG